MDAEELLRRYAARERDFSGVRLRGVFLDRAQLREINLTRADLSGTDLSNADLGGANLRGAILCGTITLPDGQLISR